MQINLVFLVLLNPFSFNSHSDTLSTSKTDDDSGFVTGNTAGRFFPVDVEERPPGVCLVSEYTAEIEMRDDEGKWRWGLERRVLEGIVAVI